MKQSHQRYENLDVMNRMVASSGICWPLELLHQRSYVRTRSTQMPRRSTPSLLASSSISMVPSRLAVCQGRAEGYDVYTLTRRHDARFNAHTWYLMRFQDLHEFLGMSDSGPALESCATLRLLRIVVVARCATKYLRGFLPAAVDRSEYPCSWAAVSCRMAVVLRNRP